MKNCSVMLDGHTCVFIRMVYSRQPTNKVLGNVPPPPIFSLYWWCCDISISAGKIYPYHMSLCLQISFAITSLNKTFSYFKNIDVMTAIHYIKCYGIKVHCFWISMITVLSSQGFLY